MISDPPSLTTDYLNHFGELVMLLEMLPDMPEAIDDARGWAPRTYLQHVDRVGIGDPASLRRNYEQLASARRQRFDETSAAANRLGQTIVEILRDPMTSNSRLSGIVHLGCCAMRAHICRLAAIISHKSDAEIDRTGVDIQSEIDALLAAAA
ncbi:hypothetical protein [Terrarubrum flagellatum]|uniref:hypothetical protein n=1 Tax=Terrirubrum flagellatum TaxID=2895980 RepID=UPI0031455482